MKRGKKLYILLGVLAVACIAMLIVVKTEEKKENIRNAEEVILSVPADSVTALSWAYEDTSLAYHKDAAWFWDEDEAFPVNEEKLNDLLSVFENLSASFIIEDVEDFGQYGLDDPTCTIRMTADGKDYEILLGAYSTMDSERYVSIGDGNVYLVSADPYDSYHIALKDTILNDKAPSVSEITSLSFSGGQDYSIRREENSAATYCDNDLYFTMRDNKAVPLDTALVEEYGADLSLLNLTEYASYNVSAEELSAWGLDDPELTATLNYKATDENGEETAKTFVVHLGRNLQELSAKAEAEAKALAAEEAGEEPEVDPTELTVTHYARVGDSSIVYIISESEYNNLIAASFDDLRHKEIFTADFADVKRIDIVLEDEKYSILSSVPENEDGGEDENKERVYTYKGEEVSLTALKTRMVSVSANSFSSTKPTEKEEIRFTFHLDNENFPTVTVSFYRYDGTNCHAVVDGETIGLVSRSDVVNIIESVNTIILG